MKSIIVGSYHRPPANLLLAALPSGAKLKIESESDNPYDENALRVMLDLGQIPQSQHDKLREELPASGHDWDEIQAVGEPIQIGYIAKSGGKPLEKANQAEPGSPYVGNKEFRGLLGNENFPTLGSLSFNLEGKPEVSV